MILTVNKTLILIDKFLRGLTANGTIKSTYNHFSWFQRDYLKYYWYFLYKERYYMIHIYEPVYGCIDSHNLPEDSNYTLEETIDVMSKIFQNGKNFNRQE